SSTVSVRFAVQSVAAASGCAASSGRSEPPRCASASGSRCEGGAPRGGSTYGQHLRTALTADQAQDTAELAGLVAPGAGGGEDFHAQLLRGGALGGERAGGAVGLLLPAVLVADVADQVGERGPLRLGHQVLQAGPQRLAVLLVAVDQAQPAGAAQRR